MGFVQKSWRGMVWVWRRISDLSTLSWLWPGSAVVLTLALGLLQSVPWALQFVIALSAFVLGLAGVILWQSRQRKRPTDFAKLAIPARQSQSKSATEIYADQLDQLSRRTLAEARFRKAAELAPDMLDHELPPKRQVPFAEALGWAVHGEWGKPYYGIPLTAAFAGIDIHALLAQFADGAAKGRLTFWGKDANGVYKKIPQDEWNEHDLSIPDIFGSGRAGAYSNLMLNKAQVEEEWPHE